jgi:multidrug resistance efflux pump
MTQLRKSKDGDKIHLSWGARSFIEAPSSKILFFSVSLVLLSIVTFFVASFFITIDKTVKSAGVTDSFNGVKETIALVSGQVLILDVKEGETVSADAIVGRLRIEGTNEKKLIEYSESLKKVLHLCKKSECQISAGSLEVAMFSDPHLKEALTSVVRKFSDYTYSQVELRQKTAREVNPLKQRLNLINKKLSYLSKSKMKDYLVMQREGLDEEKGRLEQQLISTENQLSGTVRERKNEAIFSLQLAIFQLESFIEKHQLKTPVAGKIAKIHHNIGSYVKDHEPVISIIPESSPIIARVNIPPKDVARVKEGDNVFIGIDSYPVHKFGYFSGKVLTIDRVASAIRSDNPSNGFVAKISIDTNSLSRNPAFAVSFDELPRVKLDPGMGVEVRVVTGKSKLIQIMVDKILGKEK